MLYALVGLLSGAAEAGELLVDLLDVGQGDAILITSPEGRRALIDAGTEKAEVAAQLRRMGVTHIDLVVATHPHADHIGGLQDVVESIPVDRFLHSGLPHTTRTYTDLMLAVEARVPEARPALSGEQLPFGDEAVLTVLWPEARPLTGTRSDLNSNSVVIRLDHGEDCFLFMGDAEDPSERALMRRGLETCDVLKVAHHGSDHSTSTLFLQALDPDIALISAGEDNKYGHPGEETVRRLQRQGVTIYRTDHTGHVTLSSDGDGVEVVDGLPWWSPPPVAEGWSGGPAEDQAPLQPLPPRRRCLSPAP